jgi:hypothetical protein
MNEYAQLIERLRNYIDNVDDIELMAEAADAIERLQRENCELFIERGDRSGNWINYKDERDRLRAALEPLDDLNVTTDELRRIRNAGKITFDRMVIAITTCLIDMREALAHDSTEARCASGSTTGNSSHNPDIREDTVRQARDTLCDASSSAKPGDKP